MLFISCLLASFCGFSQYHSKTEFVKVNEKKVAYSTNAIQTRKQGEPIIVFESGAFGPRGNFDTLFNYLPADLPWVTYDRPGIGQSQLDSSLLTDLSVVKHLHDFLQAIKVNPPYLLVGHSYGGCLIRMFSGTYPPEVSAMVFIDPTNFMWTELSEQEQIKFEGNSVGATSTWKALSEKMLADHSLSPGRKIEVARMSKNSTAYFPDYRTLPAVPDIPITVMISYNFTKSKDEREYFPQYKLNENFFKHYKLISIRDFQKLVENNKNSSVVALPGYPHYIHYLDPQRVAQEIMNVRNKSLLQK